MLDAIQVHAPDHANRNNLGGPLELDVTVTLYNAALRTEDSVRPPVDIVPAPQESDEVLEGDFLRHPDEEEQPQKRRRKSVTPHWEDVLLGVRTNTKRPKR